jgi:hypothetical protein
MHVHTYTYLQFSCPHLTFWCQKLALINVQCDAEKTQMPIQVISHEQACSVLYLVWENSAKFCVHLGNMKFNKQN